MMADKRTIHLPESTKSATDRRRKACYLRNSTLACNKCWVRMAYRIRWLARSYKIETPMQIGIVGLGRMGGNMARRLMTAKHEVVVYYRSAKPSHPVAKKRSSRAQH